MKPAQKIILAVLAVLILGAGLMLLPPVQERVLWRLDELRLRAFYALNPPEQKVFTPDERVVAAVNATLTKVSGQQSPTPQPSATQTVTPLPPDAPTPTATATVPPLPASALVDSVPYVDQHYGFNNCAPANLTMALKFWGWDGAREDVSAVVKPFAKDKNVMPYELVDYVNANTNLRALTRIGGSTDLLKRLIINGYPVIVESGVYLRDLSGKVSWMGHYQVVYGYDDATQLWQVKDSYEQGGNHYTESYADQLVKWRAFNYAFIVTYPAEKEGDLMNVLGGYADDTAANQIAAQVASNEYVQLTGQDKFFALFNRGTALYRLQDYNGASQAYDEAFQLYATLAPDKRPWRMLWYQTGPYFAYFNAGRYSDVINLTTQTIDSASEPYLEESYYWRARAEAVTGDRNAAIADLNKSLEYHPDFTPSVGMLQEIGASQ